MGGPLKTSGLAFLLAVFGGAGFGGVEASWNRKDLILLWRGWCLWLTAKISGEERKNTKHVKIDEARLTMKRGAIFLQICTRLLLAVWSEDRDQRQKTDVILVVMPNLTGLWNILQLSGVSAIKPQTCMYEVPINQKFQDNKLSKTKTWNHGWSTYPPPPPRNLPYTLTNKALLKGHDEIHLKKLLSSQIQPAKISLSCRLVHFS